LPPIYPFGKVTNSLKNIFVRCRVQKIDLALEKIMKNGNDKKSKSKSDEEEDENEYDDDYDDGNEWEFPKFESLLYRPLFS
jgi:hypothetical protein